MRGCGLTFTPFAKLVLAGLPATNLPGNANKYRSMPCSRITAQFLSGR